MVAIKLFFFFAFLVSISISDKGGPCSITTRADKYLKCRDKEPYDPINEVCCFLKTNTLKRCVEIRREDIKGKDNFKKTKEAIKAGTYDLWLDGNYTGFDEYREGTISIGEIDSLRCNNSKFLKTFAYFAIFFIFF
ncbi:MAG: hypothetical protein J5553_00900 [Verrucomicrobia bacterium]|nr:hypothetical protein [Verrucomicrobiota bacterium]